MQPVSGGIHLLSPAKTRCTLTRESQILLILDYLVGDIALAGLWASQNRQRAIGILARENNIDEDIASLALGADLSTAVGLTL